MRVRIARRIFVIVWLVVAPAFLVAAEPPTGTPHPRPCLHVERRSRRSASPAAPSRRALLDQFLAAITAGDLAKLNSLRVTSDEYGSIIVPGMSPKGQPPRTTFAKVNAVFFGMLDSRSRYAAQALIDRFKDKKIVRREVTFTKPTQEWLWYTARGELRLELFDDQGERYEMKSGWIAEVDGRFKFIGFNWDN